ncbi:MAG: SH3 domain-containing protein [Burkholderiales bacterium]|nr:SH3 domain-containing protein [Burkholderiales bacterium]
MMKRWIYLLALAAVAVGASETGTLRYAGELKDKPFLDAGKISDLPANASLEIVARQGAWMQVKTQDGKTGWVKMLSVKVGTGETKAGSNGAGLLSLASAFKTGSSGTTATTGVKGLSEEDLQNAQPNPAELAKLEAFGVSADDAAKFAKVGKLTAQKDIAYLSKPDDKQH